MAKKTYIAESDKGIANGIASLDSSALIPSSQLLGGYNESKIYTFPLTGIVDDQINLLGENRTVKTGEVGDYTLDFPVSNQHVFILVNSVVTGGDIVITGSSINESTGLVTVSDSETITIDTTAPQYYQTSKKWWEITNIDITTGTIVSINYDIGVLGYTDSGNMNFKITGYRVDAYSQSGAGTGDFSFVLTKVKDDGAGKMSFVTLEDIGVDSGNASDQIIDNLRTAGNNRSFNPSVSKIWLDNTALVFKQDDFDSFFSSNENQFESLTKNEGFILSLEGSPSGGISGVDFITILLNTEPIII